MNASNIPPGRCFNQFCEAVFVKNRKLPIYIEIIDRIGMGL